ncbi:MAG: HD domain-containing protein [Planctomycetes bacterium]|nr:HD domain-containing protein [Planctomycetota bacterium]
MQESKLFRQPDFLTDKDLPLHRIRCPVHGFIRFSENERTIIDHWIFRRLRHIKQLALTDLVYPGACHTRFEHSLGVMELATRAFDQIAASRGAPLEANLAKVVELREKPLAIARQLVRLAALRHDIGHACFSHAAETVITKAVGTRGLPSSWSKKRSCSAVFWTSCISPDSRVSWGRSFVAGP